MIKPLHANYDSSTGRLLFAADGFAPVFCDVADFWRLHLDYCHIEKNRELGVYSHSQTPDDVRIGDGEIVITYRSLVAEDGITYPIGLTCTIREIDGELDFAAEIDNRSEVRVNELQYPVAEFRRINDDFANDVFYAPAGLGLRAPNPLAIARKAHTEYMAADYKNSWSHFVYPGKLSMPWFGIQSGGHYISMTRRDTEACRITTFALGTGPREEETPRLLMAVCSYPAVIPGEQMTLGHYRISVSDKDWRDTADAYRKWSNETWLAPRIDEKGRIITKNSIRHLKGWQRIIMKHQYGEIYHKYADLPRLYEEGARYGIHMILLFGWWKEGMDNGYPGYEPDEALGGADALRDALREINAKGGRVVLYANGQLIDTATDYYKNEGWKYTKKNIEKSEYREFYRFGNNGSLLRVSGLKTFCMGCFGTEGWRSQLRQIKDKHLALGSNGTFFDQFSCCFYLCFDESHDHGNRIDLDPQLRVNLIREIHEGLSDDEWFGSEWVLDRISTLLDFTHGCGVAMAYKPEAYPNIFRYTFPEIIVSNRHAHDEKPIWRKELNYAFVHGLIFDVGLYRCRAHSIEDFPNYAAYLAHLNALREQYCDFFIDGRFDLPSIDLPRGVWAAEYTLGDRRILAVWNDTQETLNVSDYPAVEPGDVGIWTLA